MRISWQRRSEAPGLKNCNIRLMRPLKSWALSPLSESPTAWPKNMGWTHYRLGAISLAAFLLATPYKIPFLPSGAKEEIMVGGGIPLSLMGSKGLFVAMIIAMLSTEIYRLIIQRNFVFKMPDGVPPAVSKSFVALIPGFAVIFLIWGARLIVEATPFESLHNIVSVVLGTPLSILGEVSAEAW